MTDSRDIVVVGGGIIGIAVASALGDRGRDVTIVDRTGICEETSSGNAAALAFSDILPLAQKGMIGQVPRWLADPLGPLSISPAYLPRLMPWLWKFWRAGRPANYQASVVAQATMMQLAEREWMALMDRTGTRPLLREDGCLELYESEAEWRDSLKGWAERQRFGIEFRHVRGTELTELQSGLSDRFVAGTFVPGWKTIADPQRLGKAIWRHAESGGAHFLEGEVKEVGLKGGQPHIRLADGRTLRATTLVIAAGAWSHRLARNFGDRIPLETERGYNTTLPAGAFDLKRQLVFSRHGFVVTPLETGLRIGGAVEFAGLERPPNYARSKAMLEKAQRFMPGLKNSGGREWMGYRPSLPDTLPVIGTSPHAPNVHYAFGHGHLGLTQSAATGRLIADLVAGQAPAIDLSPFRPDRF